LFCSVLFFVSLCLQITTRDNGETVVSVSDIMDRTIQFTPGTSPFVLNSLGVGGILIVDDGDAESGASAPVRGKSYGPSVGRDDVSRGCDDEFTSCHPLLGSPAAGGFAPQDNPKAWANVLVPVVLVTKRTGDKLKQLMGATQSHIPGFGLQWLVNNNEGDGDGGEAEPMPQQPMDVDHNGRIRGRLARLMNNRGAGWQSNQRRQRGDESPPDL
jgi:hypothetical protein